jgi:hypothetical protein
MRALAVEWGQLADFSCGDFGDFGFRIFGLTCKSFVLCQIGQLTVAVPLAHKMMQ